MKKLASVILLLLMLISAGFSQASSKNAKGKHSEKQVINPDGVVKSPSYSQAIVVTGGKMVFVSGQVALNAKGELVGSGDLKAQTIQAFENMKAVLAASGATFGDLVKFTFFVKNYDPAQIAVIRSVRDSYLPKGQPPPASTLVGVQSLFRDDVLIEIEAIAVVSK